MRHGTTLRDLLPEESFVPFQVRRLADPSLVWESPDPLNQEPWLEEFAYAIPSDLDSSAVYAAESKTFWAERYGGYGLLGHGGGVRVGLNGKYQVKGIGTNPLRDSGVALGEWNFWHSHGTLSLSDAIQEAAWGEVFSRALPFGGLRVAAVVGTGGRCWCKSSRGQVRTEERALAIREAALRPAHFLRAVTYRAEPGLLIAPDAARVAAAIRRLPGVLPSGGSQPAGREAIPEPELVAEGLREFLRRSAEQCAAARSKRLMHGALAGSNVALDGRWLDYGTASALPQYANTHNYGLPSSIQTFWEDHLPFILTIKEICFYIGKYQPNIASQAIACRGLSEFFIGTYEAALRRWFLSLTGAPEEFYSNSRESQEMKSLADILIAIARYGVSARFRPATWDLGIYGRNTLGLSLIRLALGAPGDDVQRSTSELIGSDSLGAKLLAAYKSFFECVCSKARQRGISKEAIRRVAALNAARAGLPARGLFRPVMWLRCEQMVDECNGDDVALSAKTEEFMQGIRDFGETVLAPKPTSRCMVYDGPRAQVSFDAHANAWRISRGAVEEYLPWGTLWRSSVAEPFESCRNAARGLVR